MQKHIMEAATLAKAALSEGKEPVIIVGATHAEDVRKAVRKECGEAVEIEDEVSSSRSIVQMRIKKAEQNKKAPAAAAAAEKP